MSFKLFGIGMTRVSLTRPPFRRRRLFQRAEELEQLHSYDPEGRSYIAAGRTCVWRSLWSSLALGKESLSGSSTTSTSTGSSEIPYLCLLICSFKSVGILLVRIFVFVVLYIREQEFYRQQCTKRKKKTRDEPKSLGEKAYPKDFVHL